MLAGLPFIKAYTSVLFPDPDDCRAYYEHENGVAIRKCCPADLYFCMEKQMCTWMWDTDCMFDCLVSHGSCEAGNDNDTIKDAFLKCEAGGVETLVSSSSGEISFLGITIKVSGKGKMYVIAWERWACVSGPGNTCKISEQGVKIIEVREL
ncbi:MAG: carbohydrate-binding module family 14 protein [Rikenellaceae bacterium]|nr:carbohydrate-binding module family 14 protein [Rikenellaceae bacterium]